MQRKSEKQTVSPLARHPSTSPDRGERQGSENLSSHPLPDDSLAEAETEIVWRPKRGSLQLPNCSEGTLLQIDVQKYEKHLTQLQ